LKIFNNIDIDHSGWINIDELFDFYKEIGFDVTESMKELLIKRLGDKLNF